MVAENSTPIFQYGIASNDPDRVTVETRVNGQILLFLEKIHVLLLEVDAMNPTKLAPEAAKSTGIVFLNVQI